ncbi:MAG: hypothetical protein ACYTG0_47615 [Planctomycetota bacterium]|jgi:hypothetical protein
MNSMRFCGHLLLWFGFLLGAFIAVITTEVQDAPWSTISWPAYGAALLVAIAGVVLLRATKRPVRVVAGDEAGAINELEAILVRLHSTVEGWNAASEEIPVYDFHDMIDDQLADDLGRFAELREALIPEFGLDEYARIMTEFALAERTINRVWSASADGYIDEVRASLGRAGSHLSAARQCLNEASEARRSGAI